jgi:protocatechuate 3,4-dioxygenase beta subunit
MSHDPPDEHDLGLAHDLPTLLNRRHALGLLSGAGLAAALSACGLSRFSDYEPSEAPGGGVPRDAPRPSVQVEKGEIPQETGGPFPADGSNGRNVLNQSGIVRSDITGSFGAAKGVAKGVPTTIALTLLNQRDGRTKPFRGAAIYLWQCDSQGRYSLYHPELTGENYLRGVQVADRRGRVTFRSIYPAAYRGRWPHIHFEVFKSEKSAVRARDPLRTSQIALPEKACRQVYASEGYELSRANFQQKGLAHDTVFRDGYDLQMATVTGSVRKGLRIALEMAI